MLTVNGTEHWVEVEKSVPLLFVLRNDLSLNGPKYGCGYGECGACAVLIDDLVARSCVVPVGLVEGRKIVTLEGLASGGVPHPVQQCFIEAQAAQCGYCLNGMIITAKALLDRNPSPTQAEIKEEFRFNLCRCGAQVEILNAVKLAAMRCRKANEDEI